MSEREKIDSCLLRDGCSSKLDVSLWEKRSLRDDDAIFGRDVVIE